MHHNTRHLADTAERLLAPDFHEIGQSGRHWNRAQTIAELASSDGDTDTTFSIEERRADQLADDVLLLTYLLEFAGHRSRRSSIWSVGGSEPLLLFHQGTPIPN
ncbi:hypothetical protein BH09ACT4_BH09ACT4_04250 [soil metagenome]